jgi:CPA1 family monovalent cation:H+ antiporter
LHGGDILILSIVLVAGFVCQWLAWRLKLPSILFLLLTGILVGPVLHWLDPDAVFGDLLEPMVALAVALILYEGSVTLKLSEIRGQGAVVRNLVTVGVLLTWSLATVAAMVLLGWDTSLALLFGAIVTVSGPTVIIPLLRTIRPVREIANILRWEGILVDPLGAILAVLVFIFVTQTTTVTEQVLGALALIIGLGVGLGVIAGQAFGVVLRNHWVPDYLRDYAVLAAVMLVFGIAETIQKESGLLAVTVMGVWQANMRDLELDDIIDFKESLTLVLVAGLFIVLAARIDLPGLLDLGIAAVGVVLFLQFVAGPLRALLCSLGSDLGWRERLYLGWIFPRGIVAAAVSALFALRLERNGFPGAEQLVPMVFTVIVGTVVIQSLSGGILARWLRVSTPEANGVLVVGANPAARAFAEALMQAGHQVVVASTAWRGISKARMAGVPVFYGSAVSRYADRHLELVGFGNLLALSTKPDLNELACLRYRYEFGRNAVYTMPMKSETEKADKHQVTGQSAGRLLYGGQFSIEELEKCVRLDMEPKTTEITDAFGIDAYRDRYPERVILFVTDKDGRPRFPLESGDPDVRAGWKITALAPVENNEKSRAIC